MSNIDMPKKVTNFVNTASHKGLVGMELYAAFMRAFPKAINNYEKPPQVVSDRARGIWRDPETRLGLLDRYNGNYELY